MQFRPDAHHRSVQEVLQDRKLSSDEKRAILSAWASDMYAVESSPMLRMIPGHTMPLRLSEILSALHDLIVASARQEGAMKRMPIFAVTLWLGVSVCQSCVDAPNDASGFLKV
jgi:hypothetical protein